MGRLGIDIVYSVINEDVRDMVYHHESIRHVRRKTTLTGFVPEALLSVSVPKYADRPTDVGYRARRLFASLGAFAQEKWLIGERFKKAAEVSVCAATSSTRRDAGSMASGGSPSL